MELITNCPALFVLDVDNEAGSDENGTKVWLHAVTSDKARKAIAGYHADGEMLAFLFRWPGGQIGMTGRVECIRWPRVPWWRRLGRLFHRWRAYPLELMLSCRYTSEVQPSKVNVGGSLILSMAPVEEVVPRGEGEGEADGQRIEA